MSFVVHTEDLNLVSAVAEAEHDEEERRIIDGGKGRQQERQQQQGSDWLAAHHDYSSMNISSSSMPSHAHELRAVVHLLVPTTIIQLGSTFPGFITASYIGRNFTNIVYLDGFTLAVLTGNLFTLSLCQGLFSASDTLSPQAYGAGNKPEVGLLAIRGFVGSMLVTLPIAAVLGVVMNRVLRAVGEDAEAAELAWHWYQIYALALPFYALYQVTWKFLSAQNVMMPLTVCVMVSCSVVLPLALTTLGSLFGYWGTAVRSIIM